MGIKELGFMKKGDSEIIVLSREISGIECFLEQKENGKYFIYHKDSEVMFYPEDLGYYPIKTKKEILLRPENNES